MSAAVHPPFTFLTKEIQEVLDLALSLDARASGRIAMQAYLSGSFFLLSFRLALMLGISKHTNPFVSIPYSHI